MAKSKRFERDEGEPAFGATGESFAEPAPAETVRANDGVPEVPPPEPGPERPEVTAAGDAIDAADAELKRLRAEVADLKRQLGRGQPEPKAGERRATVTAAGMAPEVVAFDAAHPNPEQAAIDAFHKRHGIWAAAERPAVDLEPKGD